MRRTLATIGAALAIGVLSGVLVNAALSGPEQRTITASPSETVDPGASTITGKVSVDGEVAAVSYQLALKHYRSL